MGTALVAGATGAAIAVLALVCLYRHDPAIHIEMDRPLPSTVTGFHALERHESLTYAWTGGDVAFAIPGVDRRAEWRCHVAVVNWRPVEAGPASVGIMADGREVLNRTVTEPAASLEFRIPPAVSREPFRFSMGVTPVFEPGGSDPRALGIVVDAVRCEPLPGRRPMPAGSLLGRVAASGGLIGTAAGAAGLGAVPAILVALAAGLLQAVPLTAGMAPYVPGAPPVLPMAAAFAALALAAIGIASMVGRCRLSFEARLAVFVSAGAAYLQLLFLLHPDKQLVDALFHAHRLEWVLQGRFYFTQLSTSATPFPYAIGLYLVAAPFSLITSDLVMLLRVVVSASSAIAGGLLYLVVTRSQGDRLAGVLAVLLFHLVPVAYVVVGHANLTSAFGQSAAVAVVAYATTLPLGSRFRALHVGALALLAMLAFISHVSTLALLLAVLGALALFHVMAREPAIRSHGRSIAAATAAGLVLATALYWGHFGDVYLSQLEKLRERPSASSGSQPGRDSAAVEAARSGEMLGQANIPLRLRTTGALAQTQANIGWPILILAAVGIVSLNRRRPGDRLLLAVAAWAAACLAFLAFAIVAPSDVKYQQDAWEFIGRVEHVTSPAAVVLAALGAASLWRSHGVLRCLSVALTGWAIAAAASIAYGWLR